MNYLYTITLAFFLSGCVISSSAIGLGVAMGSAGVEYLVKGEQYDATTDALIKELIRTKYAKEMCVKQYPKIITEL